ncbi:hypothetical protein [Halalkalibacter alkalisediminis]|uniref:Uncharacterized protein n=1 Tax=Halalkalibacter alkalisediminis TaxID=935616 RepID=A0ABV6NEA8_9BACI|nr:hypothetical protein [Halalkalibacter alkalisediminis]
MAKKTNKKKAAPKISASEKYAFTMKMVTSDTCFSCKQQCTRGLAYLNKMSVPGAIGKGVPCVLTKGRATNKR